MAIVQTRHRLFEGRHPMSEAEIQRVIGVVENVGAQWVLVGAHAIGLVTEPRATADFDFIVEGSRFAATLEALEADLGELDAADIGAGVALRRIGVDLIRSTNHALFHRALSERRRVGGWFVPRTEVLIALKFLSAVSPWRDRNKRRLDVADLGAMWHAVPALDRPLVLELGALAYPGAERQLGDMLDRIDRGDPISI